MQNDSTTPLGYLQYVRRCLYGIVCSLVITRKALQQTYTTVEQNIEVINLTLQYMAKHGEGAERENYDTLLYSAVAVIHINDRLTAAFKKPTPLNTCMFT